MLNKIAKGITATLLIVSIVDCAGWVGQEVATTFGGFVDRQTMHPASLQHVVQKNDTLYGIAEKYYSKNEGHMSFAEFYYNVRMDNPSANRRFLQPGEVVTVNYYTATKHQ